jgi:hypothetical protein
MQPPIEAPNAPPQAPAAPLGQYEFTADQNVVIGKLASRMRLAGIIQIVFGALQLVGNCGMSTGEGSLKFSSTASPIYLALIVVGALMIAASISFRRIVDTEGRDISHLMEALGRFSTSIIVQLITYIILGLLLLLAIVVLIVVLLFFAAFLGSILAS